MLCIYAFAEWMMQRSVERGRGSGSPWWRVVACHTFSWQTFQASSLPRLHAASQRCCHACWQGSWRPVSVAGGQGGSCMFMQDTRVAQVHEGAGAHEEWTLVAWEL